MREAVLRELKRGGQIYYLHNDIATIATKAEKLRALVPEARLAIAHGQMPERELERVMREFYQQRCNLLLCSTIIESGLDVPTANTIIIDRADRFGLAQLHQLRGRVGRSHHQAYAYLLTPPEEALSTQALLACHRLRIAGEHLGVVKIDSGPERTQLQFGPKPDFDPAKLIALIQKDGRHRLAGQNRVRIERAAPSLDERVALVREFLGRLS